MFKNFSGEVHFSDGRGIFFTFPVDTCNLFWYLISRRMRGLFLFEDRNSVLNPARKARTKKPQLI